MQLGELAQKLGCELEGDEAIEINGVATLEDARAGHLSFLTNTKYYSEAKITKASAVLTGYQCPPLDKTLLRHENPYLTFAKAIEIFHTTPKKEARIHPTAWISQTARLGQKVSVGAYAYVGKDAVIGDQAEIGAHCTIEARVTIGEQTRIRSGAVILEDVAIGRRCLIHSNAVIGADGFGFAKQQDGSWYKIYQAGTVVIEDDVEIGACTTIDRSTLGETKISSGAKLDNLVQVGHGSSIGKDSLICAQVGLAGSTKVGRNVILAGQVGSAGHLTIGDRVVATGQTGIPGAVEPDTIISGSPSFDHKNWLKSSAIFAKLPEVQKKIRDMERRVTKLEEVFKV